jgi:ankyrin repeat protein
VNQVDALLAADPQLIRATNDNGNTPLHMAVREGPKSIYEMDERRRLIKILMKSAPDLARVPNKQHKHPWDLGFRSGYLTVIERCESLDRHPSDRALLSGHQRN